MDELIARIEELTADNTALRAANEELEKQNKELLELEAEGQKLTAELDAAHKLNTKLQKELEFMQSDYAQRLCVLDSLSKSASEINPAAIERLASSVDTANKAAEGITDAVSYVKQQASRYFIVFSVMAGILIGGVGVAWWNISRAAETFHSVDFAAMASQVNEILYLLSLQ